jgi:hypothetical protein
VPLGEPIIPRFGSIHIKPILPRSGLGAIPTR